MAEQCQGFSKAWVQLPGSKPKSVAPLLERCERAPMPGELFCYTCWKIASGFITDMAWRPIQGKCLVPGCKEKLVVKIQEDATGWCADHAPEEHQVMLAEWAGAL